MAIPDVPRTLWFTEDDTRFELEQSQLLELAGPIVLLGEAGLGKTSLMQWLAASTNSPFVTARYLIHQMNPANLAKDGTLLLVDGLDEVSARGQGDAIDEVLRQLSAMGYPRFVIACRVADWNSATSLGAIREHYAQAPHELHLCPLTQADIATVLSRTLDAATTERVIAHFRRLHLQDLLSNPQTLDFVARIAKSGSLPVTKTELFERAIELLLGEHRDDKAAAQPPRNAGLAAAGAVCSAIVLTGSDSVACKAPINLHEGEISLSELGVLADPGHVDAILGTRLFVSIGSDRFTYAHRSIGEFVGASWLAKAATTPRRRRRLLALLHSQPLVPASLRGIHAWLAINPALLLDVIAADPMGFVEYGDADRLTIDQGRILLRALETLAASNPNFRTWGKFSLRGVVRAELAQEVKRVIFVRDGSFWLQMLLIEGLEGTDLLELLRQDLFDLAFDSKTSYALRSAAMDVLRTSGAANDWPGSVRSLIHQMTQSSIRLALEVMNNVGYEAFEDVTIAEAVLAHERVADHTIGLLFRLQRFLPSERIESVLAILTKPAESTQALRRHPANDLKDFVFHLVLRRLQSSSVAPERLWQWIKPFKTHEGYNRDGQAQIDAYFRERADVRRAIQVFTLREKRIEQNIWRWEGSLRERSAGLAPDAEDIVALLQSLAPEETEDSIWHDLVALGLHQAAAKSALTTAAGRFTLGREAQIKKLEELLNPTPSTFLLEWAQEKQEREAKHLNKIERERETYSDRIEDMRNGVYSVLIDPAKCYLNLLADLRSENQPHERITAWLRPELAEAAHGGFEKFFLEAAEPMAEQIVDAITRDHHFQAEYLFVAALAERIRTGRDLRDIPDTRLLAGYYAVLHHHLEEFSGIGDVTTLITAELDRRGIWLDAMTGFLEPQLATSMASVHRLYELVNNRQHSGEIEALAEQWLTRFPDMSAGAELSLIDRLLRGDKHAQLASICAARDVNTGPRALTWLSVGILINRKSTLARFTGPWIPPELIWPIRDRLRGEFGETVIANIEIDTTVWIVGAFRHCWPHVSLFRGESVGMTNPSDASDFISSLITQLAMDISDEGFKAIRELRLEHDSYSEGIKIVSAEQERKRVEARFAPLSLGAFAAVFNDQTPVSIEDLLAFMLEELSIAQAKISSDDVDSWRGFVDDGGVPFDEERCRDHLLSMLRQGSEGIDLIPEAHVGLNKEADITCATGHLRLPIEVKGQWHDRLWTGADEQLDRYYTPDWRAERRGIYAVLWFGERPENNKKLKSPPRGLSRPTTVSELIQMLRQTSTAAQENRVAIVVIDCRAESHVCAAL